jgi:hypothetical protein
VDINICTTNRPVNYLAITLESVRPYCVSVVSGCSSVEHIPNSDHIIRVVPVDDEWEKIKHLPVNLRGAWNYRRCLINATSDVLVLEDDVILSHGWYDYLEKAISSIPDKLYILSLYCLYPLKSDGDIVQSYPNPGFGGTCGVYYPKPVHSLIIDLLHSILLREEGIWDWAIRDFAQQQNIPIYTVYPNLVQHIGRVSTIGVYTHTSPNFRDTV